MGGVNFQVSATCRLPVVYTCVLLYKMAHPGLMARAGRTHGTISLPVPLLEEIDKVVAAGLLGFRSRAELVAEATRAYLRDLHKTNPERERKETNRK